MNVTENVAKARGSRSPNAIPPLYATRPGSHVSPGAVADAGGVNFCIFARDATAAELRLYESADSDEPLQSIVLDPDVNRTFFFWHVYVERLPAGTYYTWRVATHDQDLEAAPELLDPWARAVSDSRWDRRAAMENHAVGKSFRAIVTQPLGTALHRETPLTREVSDRVIYEMHVGGFTRHPSASVRYPGTFSAVVEKIPYLKELGITHVELLPVMAFDEQDVPASTTALGLKNYWGYSSCCFYAPHPSYCVNPAQAPQEFRDCVRALHEAGIGVLLDVVFNHTAEGGAEGPIINFKALADHTFYMHEASARRYRDFTGCGNTVNCNHPLVTKFILGCLEYWVDDLEVDGFRFDLASVFTRDENGTPLADPPLTWGIELSHALVRRPVVAEAWDAAGLYQVGSFPGMRWSEWNGRYRDVLRRFVRGDPGLVGEVATRICGSQDMYGERSPLHSVNFITCHDGFTLYDLVSNNSKHNDANGENNRDGNNDNMSWNCGIEGETADGTVLELRLRQAKNFMAVLLLSQGTPMILSGDEVLRTQHGNNNAYSQDNELSWFDWRLLDTRRDMLRFTRELIALRKRHPNLRRIGFFTGRPRTGAQMQDIEFHGERLREPQWFDGNARLLAFTLAGTTAEENPLHIIFNMWHEARTVDVPTLDGLRWRRVIDTSLPSPQDVTSLDQQDTQVSERYVVQPRSVVVLEGSSR